MRWIGEFGAGLLVNGLYLGILFSSIWLAYKLTNRFVPEARERAGCALMAVLAVVFFIAIGLVFWPAIEVLKSYSCGSASDYEMCMDPPPR